ncbi:DUF418 domain-containing protein [Nocardiopsis sp. NPDC050513]|uniref:DUF418 domain-containing protein n=1 Tax=Nocardiopsis sp. NPDC050513 TaxID=3364338 RepID=UPI0037A2E227
MTHGPVPDRGRTAPPTAERRDRATARIPQVDALRGFALLGILIVNIGYLASAYHGSGIEDPAFRSPLDQAVRAVVAVFFEAKFFLLFSFLFGYSLTLQTDSAERRGVRFVPRFLRRLSGLFVLGAVHAVLLFPGDILTTYALLGVVLLTLRRLQPRTAVTVAVVLLAAVGAVYALIALGLHAVGGAGVDPAAAETAAGAAEALRGDAASVVGAHLAELPDVLFLLAFFQAPSALAAFLFGLAAGRRRVLAEPLAHGRALVRLQWVGFTVGLAGGLVYAHASLAHPGGAYQVLALGVDVVTAPLLAAAYAATVLRLSTGRYGSRLTDALAPPGRMALTHYLGQSLVCALLFTGYGAALVGRVPPLGTVVIALALFAAQAAVSRRWLRHHPYGPLEWLLRVWTTLAPQPFRRRDGAAG